MTTSTKINTGSAILSTVPTCFIIGEIEALPVTCDKIEQVTQGDPILSKVVQFTKKEWPIQLPESLKPFRRLEPCVKDDCVLWGTCVIIPHRLQPHILSKLHRDHPGICRMK